MQQHIEITFLQSEILRHRLEVPDAITDAIGPESDFGFQETTIYSVCEALLNGLDHKSINTVVADYINERCTTEVLRDLIDGASWIGTMISTLDEPKIPAYMRSMAALARKIEAARGLEVGTIIVPTY